MNEFNDDSIKKEIQRTFFSWKKRLLILLFNYIPLFHVSLTVFFILLPWDHLWKRIVAGFCCLYLLPPIISRSVLMLFPVKEGKIATSSKDFLVWWLLSNLQSVFCRFTFLEEFLRIFPGFYSQWLRLWGAKIGRLTYWAPGTIILNRSFIEIGDDVIFGAGVRLHPHILEHSKEGQNVLLLATVKIGDRAMVGGYSLLTAGTEIAPDENTQAFLISPPFTKWKDGHRIKAEAFGRSYVRRPYK